MITNIRNIKTFTRHELVNEDYHGNADHVSGSSLVRIYNECPADWRFAEEEYSPALHFGTASHAAFLEPDLFDDEFVKGIEPGDFEECLTSDAAIKSALKARGISGYSKFTGNDLIMFATEKAPEIDIWRVRIGAFEALNNGKTIVKSADHESIIKMRNQLFNTPEIAELMTGAQIEMSLFCEIEIDGDWYAVKVRPDIITANFEVPDYKTCASMNPEKFGRDAHDKGYWLKQAFIHDVLQAAYNQEPKMGLIAQGKNSPFIPQLYWMTEQQLQIGREQYQFALKYYGRCKEQDVWPAYFDGAAELPTPDYLAKRYGF